MKTLMELFGKLDLDLGLVEEEPRLEGFGGVRENYDDLIEELKKERGCKRDNHRGESCKRVF